MPTDAERLKAGRQKLGLSQRAFGVALGYADTHNTRSEIQKMEAGTKPIPAHRMMILDLLLEKVK